MRRFGSEGSLLDLDFLPWKHVELKSSGCENSGTYMPNMVEDESDSQTAILPPSNQQPRENPSKAAMRRLSKDQSFSAEDLSQLDKNLLAVCTPSEGSRAFRESQLDPDQEDGDTSVERQHHPPASPSSPSSLFFLKFHHRHHMKPTLSAAKLHLKSLFGQSPHSSNSDLFTAEHNESVVERRSWLLFTRHWSHVGHRTKLSRDELEKWAESLNSLLASLTGVSVFGAFLRSEFSEENLQFYQACEQYKHSSNSFSLQRRAKLICATYIQPGSPREVNLDSKTRDLTIQLLQSPSPTSLSYAQKQIYALLDTDCYPRFLQSNIYLSLLQEAD
ncbi:regulator of G-protein signaling 18 [Thalassophryne amazonica]|uniref:regulator of G-protein signaling 18 n=1 Tax=Thalassophryne amazonica TaxID=390379 RepID=UPI00147214FD|nr:regulator of G-protein signaling 18 [Thalassophryne amazonica]